MNNKKVSLKQSKVKQLLSAAISAHQSGNQKLAKTKYEAILSMDPDCADACHNLGTIFVKQGKFADGIDHFKRAVKVQPTIAQFWYSLIDGYIKNNDLINAQKTLDIAIAMGANGTPFDELSDMIVSRIRESQSDTKENCSIYEKVNYIRNLVEQNNIVQAEQQILQLIPQKKYLAELYNLLGIIYLRKNLSLQAIDAFKKSIAAQNDFALAHFNLGVCFQEVGDINAAISCYQTTIELNPQHSEAYSNLGNLHYKLNAFENAKMCFDQALKINPDFPEALSGRGLIFQRDKKYKDAFNDFKAALDNKPDFSVAYFNLGNLHAEVNQNEKAVQCFKLAFEFNSQFTDTLINHGILLFKGGKYGEAIGLYQKALEIDSNNILARLNLGVLYNQTGDLNRAIDYYKSVLERDPTNARAHFNLGVSLKDKGNIEGAIQSYDRAISIEPGFAEAYRHLSVITKFEADSSFIERLETLLEANELNPGDECHLRFAIAKVYEDTGDFQKSFRHLIEGNKLRKKALGYSFSEDILLIDRVKKKAREVQETVIEETERPNEHEPCPIFIVGMPRSGTTLIEQILSMHALVSAAGELEIMSSYMKTLIKQEALISSKEMHNLRAYYLDSIMNLAGESRYVTDKMPHNFLYIPFINSALPTAKIIHVKRDARAVCWSNFKTYFSAPGLGYSNDLEDVVSYYNQYSELMGDWSEKYANQIVTCDYDQLVEEPDIYIPKLINSLGLPWDENCLYPEKSDRSVQTASQQQVRKKVYRDSSQKWMRYKDFLGNKFDNLRD